MNNCISRNGMGKNVTILKIILMKIHVTIVIGGMEGLRNR